MFPNQSCGLGYQYQRRQCLDGAKEQCIFSDKMQILLCNQHECPRIISEWNNQGECRGDNGTIIKCGDGILKQTRECKDGTTAKCSDIETERNISCQQAGINLPECPGRLIDGIIKFVSEWFNANEESWGSKWDFSIFQKLVAPMEARIKFSRKTRWLGVMVLLLETIFARLAH